MASSSREDCTDGFLKLSVLPRPAVAVMCSGWWARAVGSASPMVVQPSWRWCSPRFPTAWSSGGRGSPRVSAAVPAWSWWAWGSGFPLGPTSGWWSWSPVIPFGCSGPGGSWPFCPCWAWCSGFPSRSASRCWSWSPVVSRSPHWCRRSWPCVPSVFFPVFWVCGGCFWIGGGFRPLKYVPALVSLPLHHVSL